MDPRKSIRRPFDDPGQIFLVLLLLPVILLLVLVILAIVAFIWLRGLVLNAATWCFWCSRGWDVLFVTSDSTIWHDYVEEHILPELGQRAVVLNWSQRRQWRLDLSVLIFRHYGGRHAFCPLAIVFRPFRRPRCFRFYEPFHAWKHQDPHPLAAMEVELRDALANAV